MFGDKLYALRTARGMSQSEPAKKLRKSKQSVSNRENNTVMPAVDVLVKICKIFDVSCDYILDQKENKSLSVEGLTDEQILHVQLILNDLRDVNRSR